MPARTRLMITALGVVLLAAGAYLHVGDQWWQEPSASSIRIAEYEEAKAAHPAMAPVAPKAPPMIPAAPVASKEFESTWAAVREADKIGDPLQRCMAYPDPPGMHWDVITVRAICARTGFTFMSLDDIRKALDEHHVKDVERAYQTYFEQSRTKRGLLSVAFRVFETYSDDATRVADRWVEATPRSAFALTARGLHSVARAGEARGSDTIGHTSDERMARMVEILAAARADLEAALRIQPRLLPAYHGLILAMRLHGGSREEIKRYAEAALKIDPADDRIYLDWMSSSEPRWGGSRDQMAKISNMASKHLEANPYLRLVMGKPRSDEARTLFIERRYGEALETYEQALSIAPSAAEFGLAADAAVKAEEPEKALWYRSQAYRFNNARKDYFDRANALFRLGKPELGKAILDEAAATNENVPGAMREIAEAYWRANRFEDAEKAYLAALKSYPRDEDALAGLSQLYIKQLDAVDKAQPYVEALTTNYPRNARGWLWKSYGNKPDAEVLDALAKYLELADRSDPNEQAMIALSSGRIESIKQARQGLPVVR